jgi:HlyD family secretion protein
VRIAHGTRALVWIDGRDEPFEGRVRMISHEASFTPYYALTRHDRSHLSYLAEIDLTGEEARELPTGIPVEVRFDLRARLASSDGREDDR